MNEFVNIDAQNEFAKESQLMPEEIYRPAPKQIKLNNFSFEVFIPKIKTK